MLDTANTILYLSCEEQLSYWSRLLAGTHTMKWLDQIPPANSHLPFLYRHQYLENNFYQFFQSGLRTTQRNVEHV
jgi:hypothetical protein